MAAKSAHHISPRKVLPPARATGGGSGVIGSALHAIASGISHVYGAVTGLTGDISANIAGALFDRAASWAAGGAVYLLGGLGKVMSATTRPEIGTSYFTSELRVMAVLGAAVALPLLLLTAIQAVVQQDAGLLVRAVLVKVPMSVAFTGVAIQLVSLGMAATDAASSALMRAANVPAGHVFTGLAKAIGVATVAALPTGQAPAVPVFATFTVALAVAFGALVLWLELALRAASIEAATLFLPLALAGVIWPATSHWARRLGETLAALILSKVVIVAVLALAVGELASDGSGGFSAIVSGIALLLLAVFSPYAMFRLVPIMESGAVGHLQGLAGQRAVHSVGRGASKVLDGKGSSSPSSGTETGITREASATATPGQEEEANIGVPRMASAGAPGSAGRQSDGAGVASGLDPGSSGPAGAAHDVGSTPTGGPTSPGSNGAAPVAGGRASAGGGGAAAGGAGGPAAAAGPASVAVVAGAAAARSAGGAVAGALDGATAGSSVPAGEDGGRIAASPYDLQGSWPRPVQQPPAGLVEEDGIDAG